MSKATPVIVSTEVAQCPECTKDAVLVNMNDGVYMCSCGASFVKWYAQEKKYKITPNKKVDIAPIIDILGEKSRDRDDHLGSSIEISSPVDNPKLRDAIAADTERRKPKEVVVETNIPLEPKESIGI